MPRLSRPSWVYWLNPCRPKVRVKCPSPVGRFTRHKSRPLLEAPWSAISQLRTELLDADRLSVAAGLVWNRACNIFQGILWPGLCVSESGSEEILPEPASSPADPSAACSASCPFLVEPVEDHEWSHLVVTSSDRRWRGWHADRRHRPA